MEASEFFETAAGFGPYRYQLDICDNGLPEVLNAQTGAGKTEALAIAWLWRRFVHPDQATRAATPRWLIYALPMRTLVDQTVKRINDILDRLHNALEIEGLPRSVHHVMGGQRTSDRTRFEDRDWRNAPERDAIFVGTIDMLLSRALNRGYGDSRYNWPISFGMFNNGTHWVFDETQLMGVAVPTSRQLQAFRTQLGTLLPTTTTWMSATIDPALLDTVDYPLDNDAIVRVNPDREDATSRLSRCLSAAKTISELELPDKQREASLATELLKHHQPGTLTIAIVNTVAGASNLYKALLKARVDDDLPVELLHSRFRPDDRVARTTAALDMADSAHGGILVSTQVLEAGIDLSAQLLYTEAAPWSSIVQRAGRCNRAGDLTGARIIWSEPAKPAPYDEFDVKAATVALRELEGASFAPLAISNIDVDQQPLDLPILRRKDLVGLFDTAPDLSGNDLDVGRFIRTVDNRAVSVGWRHFDGAPDSQFQPLAARELCSVPIREFAALLKRTQAWTIDNLESTASTTSWKRVIAKELRDGMVLLVRSATGGYTAEHGWDPESKTVVDPVDELQPLSAFDRDVANGGDTHSETNAAISLARHLLDVEAETIRLTRKINIDPDSALGQAMSRSALLHDIGKAHPIFQRALRTVNPSLGDGLWAKSGASGRLRYSQNYFRHELVSMLAVFGPAKHLVADIAEPDLTAFLIAGHHGRIRVGLRRLPGEVAQGDIAWGVEHGLQVEAVEIDQRFTVEAHKVDLNSARYGSEHHLSFAERTAELVNRSDLGPFRLALMEAIVRLADWRASRMAETNTDDELGDL